MSSISWSIVAIVANILIFSVLMCQANGIDKPELYENGKIEEPVHQNKRPYFVGSRYGRSEGYGFKDSPIVAPRNDRFFMGSRYGKRSQELIPDDFISINEQNDNINCVYTGFKDFYRCVNERSSRFINDDTRK